VRGLKLDDNTLDVKLRKPRIPCWRMDYFKHKRNH